MHLAKWTRNLKGVVIPREILHGNGEHTNLRVSNVGVGEERGAASFRNIQRVAANREGAGFVRRTEGLTVRADELDIARRAEHRAGDVDVRASVFPRSRCVGPCEMVCACCRSASSTVLNS